MGGMMEREEASYIARGHLQIGYWSCVGTWGRRTILGEECGVTVARYVGPDRPYEDRTDLGSQDVAVAFCIARNIEIAASAAA